MSSFHFPSREGFDVIFMKTLNVFSGSRTQYLSPWEIKQNQPGSIMLRKPHLAIWIILVLVFKTYLKQRNYFTRCRKWSWKAYMIWGTDNTKPWSTKLMCDLGKNSSELNSDVTIRCGKVLMKISHQSREQ